MCYKSTYFLKNLYKLYEMDFIGFGFIGTGTEPLWHLYNVSNINTNTTYRLINTDYTDSRFIPNFNLYIYTVF